VLSYLAVPFFSFFHYAGFFGTKSSAFFVTYRYSIIFAFTGQADTANGGTNNAWGENYAKAFRS
jgi:hypothetical protein